MIGKFELYADQALVTYGELNGQEGCHFYGDFEVEEMEEEDADVGGERAVDAGCQDTVSFVFQFIFFVILDGYFLKKAA
jgi:hypothetical protein